MKKRWIVSPQDIKLQGLLCSELKISPLAAQLLINRGLRCPSEAFSFLSPSLRNLHDPFKMKGMDKAVERILKAIKGREKITIYGDYDVDGTSATALLYLFLRKAMGFGQEAIGNSYSLPPIKTFEGRSPIAHRLNYYIPERLKEGYGLNNQAVKRLADSGTNLIVTTDCGIANYDEVCFANSIGLDVIVTDHHESPAKLPPAYAILNPKQPDCAFPFKELAGVGVMFNLIIALRARLKERGVFAEDAPNLRSYTDIVALGTIADMVPLIDENRILVKYGLDELTSGKRAGIKALKEVSGLGTDLKSVPIKAGSVGFQLAPRINAAGRLANANIGVQLLITEDDREAMEIARELDRENMDRQRLERDILLDAVQTVDDSVFEICGKKGIVHAKKDWHPGVIGIVASRLVERYYKPAVVISLSDGVGKGSARGIKRFHILDGLKRCEAFLEKYGGHKMAAGFTIREENIPSFKKAFYSMVEKELSSEDLTPEVSLDSYIALSELSEQIIQEMDSLAPFGLANPEPLLGAKNANIVQNEVVGNRHLKLKIKQTSGQWTMDNRLWEGIAYGMGEIYPLKKDDYDIAFIPYIDTWNGNKSLKLKIKEIRARGNGL